MVVDRRADAARTALADPRRLDTLRRTGLMDSPPSDIFDRFTRLTVTILRVPVALLTLVDAERQFFLSAVGLSEPRASTRQLPASHAFCPLVVSAGEPLVVADARRHPHLKDRPALAELDIVAYAGMPLRTVEGAVVGALCAIDRRPRAWRAREVAILRELAAAATVDIELCLCG